MSTNVTTYPGGGMSTTASSSSPDALRHGNDISVFGEPSPDIRFPFRPIFKQNKEGTAFEVIGVTGGVICCGFTEVIAEGLTHYPGEEVYLNITFYMGRFSAELSSTPGSDAIYTWKVLGGLTKFIPAHGSYLYYPLPTFLPVYS